MTIDNIQDEIYHVISNPFHGPSPQRKDMNEKNVDATWHTIIVDSTITGI